MINSLQRNDLDVIVELQSDPLVKSITQGYVFPHADEAIALWFEKIRNPGENPKNLYWAIRDKNQCIGFCTLQQIDWINRKAEVGIVIKEKQKGFGSEALRELISIARDSYGLRKLYAKILAVNEPALRLFASMQFREEGLLQEDYFFEGSWCDNYIYSIMLSK